MANKQEIIRKDSKLSNNGKNKLYGSIISAIFSYLEDRNNDLEEHSMDKNFSLEIEYFGDTLKNENYEIIENKQGEKYYAYH